MSYSLTWLPTVLKDAGLKVAEESGWPNRGHGDMGEVKGIICHHTAGSANGNMPSLKVVRDGRPGLSGPLAQLGLGRDGTFYVIAAGKCYHAGTGKYKGVTTGNTNFIGIEAENTGNKPWPAIQMEAYKHGVAAILKNIGQDASMCCGHKEYADGRKVDPTFDMVQFRQDVASILSGNTSKPSQIPKIDSQGRLTIRRGDEGELVKQLQRHIGIADFQIDGHFGPMTEAAVRRFQREHNLVPDGIVGPKTWEILGKN